MQILQILLHLVATYAGTEYFSIKVNIIQLQMHGVYL
jgi:hypothetical protein